MSNPNRPSMVSDDWNIESSPWNETETEANLREMYPKGKEETDEEYEKRIKGMLEYSVMAKEDGWYNSEFGRESKADAERRRDLLKMHHEKLDEQYKQGNSAYTSKQLEDVKARADKKVADEWITRRELDPVLKKLERNRGEAVTEEASERSLEEMYPKADGESSEEYAKRLHTIAAYIGMSDEDAMKEAGETFEFLEQRKAQVNDRLKEYKEKLDRRVLSNDLSKEKADDLYAKAKERMDTQMAIQQALAEKDVLGRQAINIDEELEQLNKNMNEGGSEVAPSELNAEVEAVKNEAEAVKNEIETEKDGPQETKERLSLREVLKRKYGPLRSVSALERDMKMAREVEASNAPESIKKLYRTIGEVAKEALDRRYHTEETEAKFAPEGEDDAEKSIVGWEKPNDAVRAAVAEKVKRRRMPFGWKVAAVTVALLQMLNGAKPAMVGAQAMSSAPAQESIVSDLNEIDRTGSVKIAGDSVQVVQQDNGIETEKAELQKVVRDGYDRPGMYNSEGKISKYAFGNPNKAAEALGVSVDDAKTLMGYFAHSEEEALISQVSAMADEDRPESLRGLSTDELESAIENMSEEDYQKVVEARDRAFENATYEKTTLNGWYHNQYIGTREDGSKQLVASRTFEDGSEAFIVTFANGDEALFKLGCGFQAVSNEVEINGKIYVDRDFTVIPSVEDTTTSEQGEIDRDSSTNYSKSGGSGSTIPYDDPKEPGDKEPEEPGGKKPEEPGNKEPEKPKDDDPKNTGSVIPRDPNLTPKTEDSNGGENQKKAEVTDRDSETEGEIVVDATKDNHVNPEIAPGSQVEEADTSAVIENAPEGAEVIAGAEQAASRTSTETAVSSDTSAYQEGAGTDLAEDAENRNIEDTPVVNEATRESVGVDQSEATARDASSLAEMLRVANRANNGEVNEQ